MTTEVQTQEQDARKLWEQIDAEDSGNATPPAQSEGVANDDQGAANAAPNADQKADDPPQSDSSRQQPVADDEPTVLRNKVAGLEAILNQLTSRLRNAEGHIGGLTSQIKQQIDAAKTARAVGAEAPSLTQIEAAQGNPVALKELEREYPEFAKALAPALDAALNKRLSEFESRLPKQRSGDEPAPLTRADLEAATESIKGELSIEQRHPGWKQTVKGAEFIGFVQNAAREVRLLASSDDPGDAIRLLDLYADLKKQRTEPSPREEQRQQRLSSAAALPTGRGSRQIQSKHVDDMTAQEYWRYLDQLDKQQAKA